MLTKLFLSVLLVGAPLVAQTFRNVTLTWTPSTTTQVTGVNVYRCTAPCTPTPGTLPLNGIVPIAVPMNGYIDTIAAIGTIYVYGVTAVAPACGADPTIPCGESLMSNTVTQAIGPRPAAPGAAPAVTVH